MAKSQSPPPPPPPPAAFMGSYSVEPASKWPGKWKDDMYHFAGNQQPRKSQPPTRNPRTFPRSREGEPRRHFLAVSERPLLKLQQREAADGKVFRSSTAAKLFRSPNEVSTSEETPVFESDGDSPGAPLAKRRRTSVTEGPKWSNPDVYTALPAPSESTGRGLGVLKMIRKAKVTEQRDPNQPESNVEDFISLDFPSEGIDDQREMFEEETRLGKRRRGDEDARLRSARPPLRFDSVPIKSPWNAVTLQESAPWLRPRTPGEPPRIALHKEVIDFYDWVKPKQYEADMRADALQRLSLALSRLETGELKAFGSYAAGLYLPTADMDLVFIRRGSKSSKLAPNGLPYPPPRSTYYRFATYLRNTGIAYDGSVQLILSAKVPLIKFVDRVSSLRIDLSFDNESGLTVIPTFEKWKSAYPAMPIIVSLIKHFLMIRGLNDVATGGLGGFSVICLVTSLLQHLPKPNYQMNLGEVLLEFFNLYGNLFDRDITAVRLDPPGYVDKSTYAPLLFNKDKKGRLTIIDPHRPENNISGGTNQIDDIFLTFSWAHAVLQKKVAEYGDRGIELGDFSFIQDLVGGNFSSYTLQRNHLKQLHFGVAGEDHPDPAPKRPMQQPRSIMSTAKVAKPGPQPSTTTKQDSAPSMALPASSDENLEMARTARGTGKVKVATPKAVRRAERLRKARPDIADSIGSTISVHRACELGGYKNGDEMSRALDAKEAEERAQNQK